MSGKSKNAAAKEPKKSGRPSSYTPEIADAICERVAMGESLASVCLSLGIGYAKVMHWQKEKPEFGENYARACEDRADWHADEILAIADDESLPPDARRVKIDARKWSAGKMKPKRYGEKVQTEHSGMLTVATKEQRDAAVKAAMGADQ